MPLGALSKIVYLYRTKYLASARYFVCKKKSKNGHGATVAYGSPKPLIWVRILVPVQKSYTEQTINHGNEQNSVIL